MKRKNLFSAALGVILLSSACNELTTDQIIPEGDLEIKFSTSLYQFTKATDTQFETGDNIGISIIKDNVFYLYNTKWTYNDGQLTSDGEYKWYGDLESTSSIVAVYPWCKMTENNPVISFTVNSDQSTHALYTASDLMLATAASKPTTEAVPLNFQHALSKIVVTLDNQLGEEVTELYFTDLYGTVILDIKNPDNIYISGEKGAIKAGYIGNNQWSLIVVPQENVSPKLNVVTKSNKHYTYSLEDNVTFRSGKLNTAQLTLYTNDKYTSFTPEIQDWVVDNTLNFSQTTPDYKTSSGLIFKELYYNGCTYKTGEVDEEGKESTNTYFRDQFYEIYNNSDEVVYADGLCIAYTVFANYDFTQFYTWEIENADDYVFAQYIWQIEGNGTYFPIQPGESVIIAQWASNHKADVLTKGTSPVDLSSAEFETIEGPKELWNVNITDGPAENLALKVDAPGYGLMQWLVPVGGANLVIFKPTTPLRTENFILASDGYTKAHEIALSDILDAVQFIDDENRIQTLGMPAFLDAGYIWCSGSYVSESIARKQAGTLTNGKIKYKDTNNTTDDFEVKTTPMIRRNEAGIPSWNTWAK